MHNLTCAGCGISYTRKRIDKRSKTTYCGVSCRDNSRKGKRTIELFGVRKKRKSATPTSRYKMPEDDILKLESPTHNLIVFHGQVSSVQQVRDVDLFDVAIEFMEKEAFNKCTIAYGQIGSPVMEVKTFYRKILAVEETP